MKLFQHTPLRRWIAHLFLLTCVLIQVQAVYACEFMGNEVQTSCCCEHEDNVEQLLSAGNATDPCCTLSIVLPLDTNLGNVDSVEPREVLNYQLEQAEAVLIPAPLVVFNSTGPETFKLASQALWYDASNTYLLTLRIRE